MTRFSFWFLGSTKDQKESKRFGDLIPAFVLLSFRSPVLVPIFRKEYRDRYLTLVVKI